MEEKIKNEELKEICERLQKYVGEEFKLVDLDNLMEEEVGTTCSLYEDFNTALKDGWCYVKGTIEYDFLSGIQLNFDLLEELNESDEESKFNVKVKVTNISVV